MWRITGTAEPFQCVHGLTIAPDGNVWAADGVAGQFLIFAPDERFLETWGSKGKGEGQFAFLRGPEECFGDLAFAADGSFYVADPLNYRVQKFDRDRNFILAWGTLGTGDGQFRAPFGVEVAANGDVYVVDDARDDIQKFDADGRFLLSFGSHGSGEGQLNFAGWMDLDAEGNVWVADLRNSRVLQFSPDGAFLRSIGEGELDHPQDVEVDGGGCIFVTDSNKGRVVVFDRDGRVLTEWDGTGTAGAPFRNSVRIKFDDQGNVYVTDYDDTYEAVQKFRLLPPLAPEATPTA